MITSPQHRIDHFTQQGWWGDKTLHGLLEATAHQYPEQLAVADQFNRSQLDDREMCRLSYAELHAAAKNLAANLLDHGIAYDQKVLVQLPNVAELVVAYYALSQIGAIVSPLPVQYGRHELRSCQQALQCTHLITSQRFGDLDLAANANSLDLQALIFGEHLSLQQSATEAQLARLATYQESHDALLNDANQILTICWTSGTTGTPKGVPRSHNMWLSTTQAVMQACEYRIHDALLNPFPLVNMAAIGGFLFPAVLNAAAIHLHHPFDPELYLQQLQQENINFTIAPPAVLNQLAKAPDLWNAFDFSALRCVGSGSAPLAPSMIETFEQDYGKQVVNFYGSNEGICLLANQQTAPTPVQRASMFPRLGYSEIPWRGGAYDFANTKVADPESGKEITEPGVAGELLINGPTIFDGYFPGIESDEVFTDDGFFRTGDLVEICGDPPYYYRIVGRCKDIINRGGVKISPAEIDQLLEGMSGLQEAAVCACHDARLGERVCACVVPLDADAPPSLTQLTAYLSDLGVAKYKLPERLEVFQQLPRNPMNKVLREQLRQAVAQRASD